jgi:hypothetical protein
MILGLSALKGQIAEVEFLSRAVKRGWGLSMPVFCSLPYDFAVLRSQEIGWEKVQCKYVGKQRRTSQKKQASIGATKDRYNDESFDLLFCYDEESDEAWLIPWSKVMATREFTPSLPKYKEYRL